MRDQWSVLPGIGRSLWETNDSVLPGIGRSLWETNEVFTRNKQITMRDQWSVLPGTSRSLWETNEVFYQEQADRYERPMKCLPGIGRSLWETNEVFTRNRQIAMRDQWSVYQEQADHYERPMKCLPGTSRSLWETNEVFTRNRQITMRDQWSVLPGIGRSLWVFTRTSRSLWPMKCFTRNRQITMKCLPGIGSRGHVAPIHSRTASFSLSSCVADTSFPTSESVLNTTPSAAIRSTRRCTTWENSENIKH